MRNTLLGTGSNNLIRHLPDVAVIMALGHSPFVEHSMLFRYIVGVQPHDLRVWQLPRFIVFTEKQKTSPMCKPDVFHRNCSGIKRDTDEL